MAAARRQGSFPQNAECNWDQRHGILEKIRSLATGDDYYEFELLTRLRQGRMMRLRQCISYSKLLGTAVTHYDENLLKDNPSLSNTIRHYDELETPAKLDIVLDLVREQRNNGEKVVIWSNFVDTLKMLHVAVNQRGHHAELIYGGTNILEQKGLGMIGLLGLKPIL